MVTIQKEFIGVGALKELPKFLIEKKPQCIFLVTGKGSYKTSGAKVEMERYLSDYKTVHFNDFSSNPSIEGVERGVALFKEHQIELVIAIGGGSVIDIAKSVSILSVHEGDPIDYIEGSKKITEKSVPLVAIPTTSGTGSESTHFAVVYVNKQKYSLASPNMLPDFAFVDPTLTYSLPANITASTGMDAFGQAVESFWSIHATDESKQYARESIKLILKNLEYAVRDSNKDSRDSMSKAAHLAGKAINISKTTASHAMSYPLTSHFGIPHGHAVGLTLSKLLVYNGEVSEKDVVDPRGVEYVGQTMNELYSILGVSDGEVAGKVIDDLMKKVGLETRLSELGIHESDFEKLLDEVSEERAGNNPRRFMKESGRDILENII